MSQHNTLNVKLTNSRLNELKPWIKNDTNFPHRLLLTNIQVWRFHKDFANNSSAKIKLWRNQLHKLRQSGKFLRRLLGEDFQGKDLIDFYY